MYIFNGDYVDRGSMGLEVVLLLVAWKVFLPERVHLIRGNHELEIVNTVYGFRAEISSKYGGDLGLFDEFNRVFSQLPVGAVVQDAVFIVHGGLPRTPGILLSQIRATKNSSDPMDGTIVSDLLWSDPCDVNGHHPSPRNIGMLFGPDVAKQFCELNGLDVIVRAHELCMEGYSIQAGGKVVTVFSAPNYCGRCQNLGAFLVFDANLKMTIRQFAASSPNVETTLAVPELAPSAGASSIISSYF